MDQKKYNNKNGKRVKTSLNQLEKLGSLEI